MSTVSDNQVSFLLDMAWKCCDVSESELKDYSVRFRQMTYQQADDLIATWKDLPVIRNAPRPTLVLAPVSAPAPVAQPVPRATSPVTVRQMPAKYQSTCPICKQQIFAGMEICYIKGLKATHIACGLPHAPSPGSAPQVTVKSPSFWCDDCGTEFVTDQALRDHRFTRHGERKYKCSKCYVGFGTEEIRDRHEAIAHLPAPVPYDIPEPGYYSVSVPINGVMTPRFYRVTQRRKPYQGQKIFARQSGDNWVSIDPVERQFAAAIILAAPILAMEAYGKLIGSCGCCGRSLTDPESRARGIGPDCAEKFPNRY